MAMMTLAGYSHVFHLLSPEVLPLELLVELLLPPLQFLQLAHISQVLASRFARRRYL